MAEPIGVLVMAYGGPDKLEQVAPYLLDVRNHRPTPPEIIHEVEERYRQIGGRSPILEHTTAQANALEAALAHGNTVRFRAAVGMRHWHPYIDAALSALASEGIRRAVGLVMAPHYSELSIGAYFRKIEAAGSAITVAPIRRWHLLPSYLDALASRVRDALARFPEAVRAQVTVVLTAHSLPQRILAAGDPYPTELAETVAAVMARLGNQPHRFAYQSAALTGDPWLGPDVGDVLDELAASGQRHVVVAPIGFLVEHVEILYDLDLELQERARSLGVHLERTEMLHDDPTLIAGLATLVRETAQAQGWLE